MKPTNADPENGTFSNGNPAESVLSSEKDRSPCNTYDYLVEVGFDGNDNSTLDYDEVVFEVPIHYVTKEEWRDGLLFCIFASEGWLFWPAAANNMFHFGGNWDSQQEFYKKEDVECECDGTRVPPQKYQAGHVHYRGLGVDEVSADRFSMPLLYFGHGSLQADAIEGSSTMVGHIWTLVVEKSAEIRQYFADHPGEDSHVFSGDFFNTMPKTLIFRAPDDDAWNAFGTAGFWTTHLEVTIQRYPLGLGIAQVEISGDLWDVYDWSEESSPADVQAAYEPTCGRHCGNVFQSKVELRDDTYGHDDFEGRYIKP
jgi:hypothetical protein